MSLEILNNFNKKKILVIGDYCVDVFYNGEADSVSPEAQVLRVLIDKIKINPGMTGNVAAGIAALGAKCYAAGVIGNDDSSKKLIDLFNEKGINTKGLILQSGRVTSEFSRVIVGGKKYPAQTAIRFDIENKEKVREDTIKRIIDFIKDISYEIDAIIIADYDEVGMGVITSELLDSIKKIAKENNIILIGDSRTGFHKFSDFTCIVPNIYEAKNLYGKSVDDAGMPEEIIKMLNLDAILITKDKDGMEIISKEGIRESFPAYAKEVVDVTGAGDSVTCAFTLALSSGADYKTAAKLSSYAAAIAVAKPGVDVATIEELREFSFETKIKIKDKLKTLEELKEIVKKHKREGKRIATTNGSFDILHVGHVYILESAKRLTDILIVLLNSDFSIKKLKGPRRPIVPERERAEMLSALECVDYVVIFDSDNPLEHLKELKPDMHIKGGTFVLERIKTEKELIESWGGKHITLPIVEGYSTTNIVESILESHKEHNNTLSSSEK